MTDRSFLFFIPPFRAFFAGSSTLHLVTMRQAERSGGGGLRPEAG